MNKSYTERYEYIINEINNMKEKLDNNQCKNGEELHRELEHIRMKIWENVDENKIENEDLSILSKVHNYLINNICEIHNNENDTYNEQILNSNINFKMLDKKLNDGKRACGIYSFTDSEYENYFIGDIHSDDFILKKILHKINFFNRVANQEKVRIIFVGDYVDRGNKHLKAIEAIMLLKYIFPNNIYLLRGNHDAGRIEEGEPKLCIGKDKSSSDDIYFLLYTYNLSKHNETFSMETVHNYLRFFYSMSNIGIVLQDNLSIMIVHGGIPRPKIWEEEYYSYINKISDLTNEEIKDFREKTIVYNMIWSDPCEDEDRMRYESGRFGFLEEHFQEFSEKMGVDLLIRGHVAEVEGFRKFFNERVYTIFSSGFIADERGENLNKDTYYISVKPKIAKLEGNQISIIDLNK